MAQRLGDVLRDAGISLVPLTVASDHGEAGSAAEKMAAELELAEAHLIAKTPAAVVLGTVDATALNVAIAAKKLQIPLLVCVEPAAQEAIPALIADRVVGITSEAITAALGSLLGLSP